MEYICDICQSKFKSANALASHRRYKHSIKGKSRVSEFSKGVEKNSEKIDLILEEIRGLKGINKIESLIFYPCPDCGSSLKLMKDGPGIFKLKCEKCFEGV